MSIDKPIFDNDRVIDIEKSVSINTTNDQNKTTIAILYKIDDSNKMLDTISNFTHMIKNVIGNILYEVFHIFKIKIY